MKPQAIRPRPYTRETLKVIRDAAPNVPPEIIAGWLGWSAERVAGVAKYHGITLLPMENAGASAKAALTKIREERWRLDIRWSLKMGEVTRDHNVIYLPRAQAELFDILFSRWLDADDTLIPMHVIKTKAPVIITPVVLRRAHERLSAIGITIESCRQYRGGSRLVVGPVPKRPPADAQFEARTE